jgi:predicted nucleic acid-binding protein
MIVVDASVVVDFLLAEPPHYAAIVASMRAHEREIVAPHLLDAEIGQVLRRLVRAGSIDSARADEAIADFLALGIIRYPHVPLMRRAFELRDNTTFYDALYLALAEALSVAFLTRDGALGTVPGHRARVDVLA